MQTSELRTAFRQAAVEFAWDQWAQLGVFANPTRADRWVADPEALLLFTLEAARHDPRLFDEMLDWLRENERAISVQRLKNLARDERDRALVEAALRWISGYRANPRFDSPHREGAAELLFPQLSAGVPTPDPAFLASGFAKPRSEPSLKSSRPPITAPIAFAFRMRELFGVNARAEIVRYLLTVPAPDVPAQLVALAAGYAKRNVFRTLSSLEAAGVVRSLTVANEGRYAIDREVWRTLLDVGELPIHRDWPQLLWAIRIVLRWLDDPRLDDLSDYMRASAARDLMQLVERDLLFSGVPVSLAGRPGAEYWESFVEQAQLMLNVLRTGHP